MLFLFSAEILINMLLPNGGMALNRKRAARLGSTPNFAVASMVGKVGPVVWLKIAVSKLKC